MSATEAVFQAVRQWLAEATDYPLARIIEAESGGALGGETGGVKPNQPFAAVRVQGLAGIGQDELRQEDDDGSPRAYTRGQREGRIEINTYGAGAITGCTLARGFIRLKSRQPTSDGGSIAFRRAGDVMNLSALVDGRWEQRGMVELTVGYAERQTSGVERVEAEVTTLAVDLDDRGDVLETEIEEPLQ